MKLSTQEAVCPSHSIPRQRGPGVLRLVLFLTAMLLPVCPSWGQGCGSRSGCLDITHDPSPTPIPKPATTWIPSPSFGTRNSTTEIDSVVMHTTEVDLEGTIDIFENRNNSVSSHFVIASNGDIYEMVDTHDSAWHATYYNSRSIGIEMVGYAQQPLTWNQENIGALIDLLAWIVTAYPNIPIEHPSGDAYDFPNDEYTGIGLVAHSQVQPWNKSDPGEYFPWDRVLSDVQLRVDSVPEPGALSLLLLGTFGLTTRIGRRLC